MQRVLLVEDSRECQMVVEHALSGCELELVVVGSLAEATRALQGKTSSYFDLILLDRGLPDGDGFCLFQKSGSERSGLEVPIFLFTQKDEIESKVEAFELGADDYLVKPVNPIELRSRVVMRLQKVKMSRKNSTLIQRAELHLDVPLLRATLVHGEKSEELSLTAKEFKLLCFLMRREGESFSRDLLVKEIWGEGIHVLERTVDSHVSALRRKLGPAARYVESVPGEGYRFFI